MGVKTLKLRVISKKIQAKNFLIKIVVSPLDIGYIRGDSMNGTPAASGQGLCAIDRVEFKVTKSSVKS